MGPFGLLNDQNIHLSSRQLAEAINSDILAGLDFTPFEASHLYRRSIDRDCPIHFECNDGNHIFAKEGA